MENLKIGCDRNTLTDYDKQIIEKLSSEYKGKIERHFAINSFEVYVKCHSKDGTVKRYEIDVRVIVPGFRFEASADEYKLSDSVHKALEKILTEIEHKAHLSNQGKSLKKK